MATIQTSVIYNKLTEAMNEGYTAVSLQGSARSGKTYNVMIWLVLYALSVPKIKISVVRATLPALKGSVLEDFWKYYEPSRYTTSEPSTKQTSYTALPLEAVLNSFPSAMSNDSVVASVISSL